MIELFDDWVIVIGDNDYQLAKPTGTKTDKRTGKVYPTFKVYGYFGTITEALKRLVEECTRERLKGRTTTLHEALKAFEATREGIAELLKKVEGIELG